MIGCLAKGGAIKGTLFDTGANFYFAKAIEDLDNNIFKDSNNSTISIAAGPTTALGSGTRTLYCEAPENDNEGKGKLYKLILQKVLLLPNVPVNIFGARKLMGKGNIKVKGNSVFKRDRQFLFKFDENLMIIEELESKTYTFPAITQTTSKSNTLPICLWY